MKRATQSRHVHFSDCDPAKIVFYPRYFIWFDQATEHLFRAADLHWSTMMTADEGAFAGVPLLGASADFKSPCKMGDAIEIESWVEDWQERIFVVAHRVHNRDRIAVTAEEKRI